MNELALFAGAGGGILASVLLGWRTVCAVEIDPYCRDILVSRQNDGSVPPFPIWDDVCTFDGRPWQGAVDVVSGGFPCQAFSTASRGRKTARDMWPEMRRVILEVEPTLVFAENVAKEPIDRAADDLEEMGYSTRCVALSARDVGADHFRLRYWLLGNAHDKDELERKKHGEVAKLPIIDGNPWQAEPVGRGVPDGLAAGVDLFRALGNGQVPVVAARAFRVLMEYFQTDKED